MEKYGESRRSKENPRLDIQTREFAENVFFEAFFGCCCTPVCFAALRNLFAGRTAWPANNFLRLSPSGKVADALQRKIDVQPVKKRDFPPAGNAGQAVWPASGVSGVRISSGHLGSCPLHSRDPFKKGSILNF